MFAIRNSYLINVLLNLEWLIFEKNYHQLRIVLNWPSNKLFSKLHPFDLNSVLGGAYFPDFAVHCLIMLSWLARPFPRNKRQCNARLTPGVHTGVPTCEANLKNSFYCIHGRFRRYFRVYYRSRD